MTAPRKATGPADAAEAIVAAELRRLMLTSHPFEPAPHGTRCASCSLGRLAAVHGRPLIPEPGTPTRPWT